MVKYLNFTKIILSVLFIGALLVISACSGSNDNSSEKASTEKGTETKTKTKDKVVVATPFPLGAASGIPNWVGEALGFYEEEGLEVEIVSLPGKPAEANGLVVAGRADVSMSQPDALVFPLSQGNDMGLTYVFSPYQAPIFGISVLESSDITSAKQLENKTVGMPALGAPYETFLKTNVKADGGDSSKLDVVAIASGSAAMEALGKGDIDAFISNQADMATFSLVTGTKTKLLPFPDDVKQGFGAGFVIQKAADEKKRDAIARYIRAVVKSAIYAQENPEKAVQLNWEMYPASKPADKPEEQALKEAVASLKVTADNYRPAEDGQWGYISEERWQKFVDNNGLTDKISDVKKVYDYSLLDSINTFDEEEVKEQAKK